MKTAVVYYSLGGNVRYAAEKIAEALQAELVELIPEKAYPDKGFKMFFWGGKAATMKEKPKLLPYRFNAEDYDTVILCTPVWVGTMTPPLRTFLYENDLKGKRIAAVASSGGGSTERCFEQMKKAAKVDSFAAVLSLVEPKTDPSGDKERQILSFAELLREPA